MIYDPSNIFAQILKGKLPCHKVYEDDKTLAFLDIYPSAKGHTLIIPKCQAVELSDLPIDYACAVFATAKKVMTAQRSVLGVQGVMQMQLNDKSAGQSVFHYHMHLIPAHYSVICQDILKFSDDEFATLAQKLKDAIKAD